MKHSKSNYFGQKEEMAIKDYINSDNTSERNILYSKIIYPAFKSLVKGLIKNKKYGVMPDQKRQDILDDIELFLYEKIDKFNPELGFKAFSYFTMVSDNYILGILKKKPKEIYLDITSAVTIPALSNDYSENIIQQPKTVTLDMVDDFDETLEYYEDKENKIDKIQKSFEFLDDHEKIIYLYYFHENLSMNKIALKLGVAEYSINRIINNVKEKIKYHCDVSEELPSNLNHKKNTINKIK